MLKTQSTAELEKAVKEVKAKAKESMDATRKDYEAKIQTLEDSAKKLTKDHNSSVAKGIELEGKIKDLTSKLSALQDEKEAILASAKDGEKDSQKSLQESSKKDLIFRTSSCIQNASDLNISVKFCRALI